MYILTPKEAQTSKHGVKSKSAERNPKTMHSPLSALHFSFCLPPCQVLSDISKVIYVNRIHYANASNLLATWKFCSFMLRNIVFIPWNRQIGYVYVLKTFCYYSGL